LLSILLDLLRVEHTLEPAGLLRELEQPLPLILGKRLLLGSDTGRVLGLALGLPLSNLGLLTSELSLVELEVVEVGVVGLDAVEEEVAGLLKERIDGNIEVVERRVERGVDGVLEEIVERRGRLRGIPDGGRGNLVEEGGEKVRVMDDDRELDHDVLEGKLGLLEAKQRRR